MDQLQPGQQGLHPPVRRVEGDQHGKSALGADHPDGSMGDALQLGDEDRLRAGGHQFREGFGLGGRLVRGKHQAVDTDKDGERRKHRQQGVEADPADVQGCAAVLGAPPRPSGDPQHGQGPMGRVVVEIGQPPPIHIPALALSAPNAKTAQSVRDTRSLACDGRGAMVRLARIPGLRIEGMDRCRWTPAF